MHGACQREPSHACGSRLTDSEGGALPPCMLEKYPGEAGRLRAPSGVPAAATAFAAAGFNPRIGKLEEWLLVRAASHSHVRGEKCTCACMCLQAQARALFTIQASGVRSQRPGPRGGTVAAPLNLNERRMHVKVNAHNSNASDTPTEL